nr:hypothetical protein [Tanacetum cinerariifolium]
MVDDNVGNQFRHNAVQNHGNGNVVPARAEGNSNGINGNQIRCYNCRGEGYYASNCIQTSTSGTQSDKALVYDSDESAELSKEKSIVSSLLEEKKKLKYDFKIREDELLDKQIQLENKIKKLDNILVKTAKFVRDFKSLAKEADESIAKQKALELEIERLLRAVFSQDIMSVVQHNSVVDTSNLQTELEPYNDMQQKIKRLQAQLEDQKIKSKDTPCVSNTLDPLSQKLENENVELQFQVLNYAKENAHLKTTYKNLFDSISVTQAQTKTIFDSLQNKLHDTIYENDKLRAQLFDKVSKQKDTTRGTSANTKFAKQSILGKPPSSSRPKLYAVTPLPKSKAIPKIDKSHALSRLVTSNSAIPKIDKSHALSRLVTSNSVPTPTESKVMKNDNVLSLGIFRMNPFKASKVDNFMPNKHVKASVRTKPITVSQPHVITKNDVNSKTNGFSPKDVKSTTKTRRPLPRNNPMNDKVPSKSKSSWLSNKLEKIKETHRNLQSSSYQEHMSSECNTIKFAIRNAKSEIACAMCKQCLINVNHDVCVLNYVNGMNSRGSKERLASSKPSTPRSCLRWSPTGRFFDLKGKIITTSESVFQSDCSKGDNACTSNPQEPISRRFPNLIFSMIGGQNWFDTLLISLLSEYKPKEKEDHGDNEFYSVICSSNYSNGENQVVSKSSAVTTADASDKRQQQQDSTSSTSTLATTVTAVGNFDL